MMPSADKQGNWARKMRQISSLPTCHPLWIPSVITCPKQFSSLDICPTLSPLSCPPHEGLPSTYSRERKTSGSTCPHPSLTSLQMLPKSFHSSLYLMPWALSRQLINRAGWTNLGSSHPPNTAHIETYRNATSNKVQEVPLWLSRCPWGFRFDPWPHSAHYGSAVAADCGVSPAVAAPIRPLARELPYAAGVAPLREKKKKKAQKAVATMPSLKRRKRNLWVPERKRKF